MLDTRVKDWSTEDHDPPVEQSYRSLRISFAAFFAVAAVVWLALFGAMRIFPYVQNGAEAVGAAKWRMAQGTGPLLDPAAPVRILAFGNSKTLAGFHPSVFEEALGDGASSYNLAIPGESRFVHLLETALASGARPTHVLVQLPPKTEPADASLWAFLLDNTQMANFLFPFRGFVRDAIIFAFEAHHRGGLAAQYASNTAQIELLKRQRGYFFIKSQSHYPGDRLPDDYSLPTDRPDKQETRRPIPTIPPSRG
ncbi:hypothetical protein [Methylocella sp.]|uniref:hypothetical protein n=1 Tax=Methylocella sp. TaxID=1978226 RepID=UPI0037849651